MNATRWSMLSTGERMNGNRINVCLLYHFVSSYSRAFKRYIGLRVILSRNILSYEFRLVHSRAPSLRMSNKLSSKSLWFIGRVC